MGAQIWYKREDLLHTGAHKINNALGQAVLAKWLGKRRMIAETGAGQHGVATATVCALFGLECTVCAGALHVTSEVRRSTPACIAPHAPATSPQLLAFPYIVLRLPSAICLHHYVSLHHNLGLAKGSAAA